MQREETEQIHQINLQRINELLHAWSCGSFRNILWETFRICAVWKRIVCLFTHSTRRTKLCCRKEKKDEENSNNNTNLYPRKNKESSVLFFLAVKCKFWQAFWPVSLYYQQTGETTFCAVEKVFRNEILFCSAPIPWLISIFSKRRIMILFSFFFFARNFLNSYSKMISTPNMSDERRKAQNHKFFLLSTNNI